MPRKLRSYYHTGDRPGTTRFELRRIHAVVGIMAFFCALFIVSLIPESVSVASRNPEKGMQAMPPLKETDKNASNSFQGDFTVLALGIAGGDNISPDLTDAILLVHMKDGKRVSVFSFPRDLYVRSPRHDGFRKINALYHEEGMDSLKKKIEEISGITIDAYAAIDLKGVTEIVDTIGGIHVPLEDDFNAYSFRGTKTVLEVPSGFRYLDGNDVVTFIRYRPDSDFGRMRRQQLVLEALRKKLFGLHPLYNVPTLLKVLVSVQSRLTTDLGIVQLESLYELAKNQALEIGYHVFDTENYLQTGIGEVEGHTVYTLEPKAGRTDYRELQLYIANQL